MTQFTIICNVLLFLACYNLLPNWEVPIKLGFDPFKIVGGFPTLIDSFFETPAERTIFPVDQVPDPILLERHTRTLNWTCSILESKSQCFSIVSSSSCIQSSQFSYTFWENSLNFSESSCFHRSKGSVDCKLPFQSGNLCENVVVGLQISTNNIIFELDDVMINTQIVQNYDDSDFEKSEIENQEENCQNYTLREMVLAGGENDTELLQLFPFGVNSTQQINGSLDCAPPFPANVFFCNCKNLPSCQVPILYNNPNSTFCGSTSVSIHHWRGFIYSVIVASDPPTSSITQQLSVQFLEVKSGRSLTNFDLKRGRFHCPSETTCFKELLYPFKFLDSLDLPHQLGVFVFSLIVGVAIVASFSKNAQ